MEQRSLKEVIPTSLELEHLFIIFERASRISENLKNVVGQESAS
jgi:hypothetical protein